MNIVELELDETLADFEIQDWIDNVFSVQIPEIKAKIKLVAAVCVTKTAGTILQRVNIQ